MKRGPRLARELLVLVTVSTLVGLCSTHAGATCGDIPPASTLPADEVCPGWVRDGETQTAETLEELTDIINGGAHLFVTYGFVAAAFQDYAGEVGGAPVLISLQVYNQGTAENAEALYNDLDSGWGDPVGDWEGSGDARMRMAFGFVTFQFWEECFFVTVIANAGGEDSVPHVRCLADEVLSGIQQATPIAQPTWGAIKRAFF